MSRRPPSPIGSRPIVPVFGSAPLVVAMLAAALLVLGSSPAAFATAGQFKSFTLTPPGFGPQQLALGSDGAVWFTETAVASIGRLGNGGFSYVSLPGGERYASDIAAGPDGALWVTEPDFAEIARVTTAGVVTEMPIPACGC